jgi:hypothetical protein
MRRGRHAGILVVVGACFALVVGAGGAGSTPISKAPGFQTDDPPMLRAVTESATVQPIITVGEELSNGYMFESLPDGIVVASRKLGRAQVYVNHETSTVPFPLVPGDPEASLTDFTNALLSKLRLSWKRSEGVGVQRGEYVIPSEANYQRFCSNFLAGPNEGFDRPLLFTNEEATDFVFRTGQAWPAPASEPPAEQAGVVVAYDPATGEYKTIYGMGRHNHENSVAVPGYGHPVVLSGDDTFSAPASQMYMYTAEDSDAVWDDAGQLWAFKSDDAAINDYGDLRGSASVSGEFIPVPEDIARGPQTPLEEWSNANGVFQFIRVEDIAYDRTDPHVVYFADTGEPRAERDPATGRLVRMESGYQGPFPNGRIFKMVLDQDDPTKVDSLSILINADRGGYNNPSVIHQPDNLETTSESLLIQEDPGSHNQFPGATNARVWRFGLGPRGNLEVVAEVDQSLDPDARPGAWESSGIVDASAVFGRGAFLVDVQAHTLFIDTALLDVDGDGVPDVTQKREGGQLLLLRLPDA